MRINAFCRAVLVCMVMAGLVTPWVRAQEDDQDTGKIFTYHNEILFPAAVRFFVSVEAPLPDIRSATLDVRQESGLRRTFVLNLEENVAVSGEAAVELVYTWELAEGPVPVAGEPLTYIWRITTADRQVSTLEDEFLFADTQHGEWQVAGEAPLILLWSNEHLGGESLREEVMVAYSLLSRRTGRTPFFRIAIYDPGVEFCETYRDEETGETSSVVVSPYDAARFPCSLEQFIQIYERGGTILLQRQTRGYTDLQDQLIGTLVRAVYGELWQGKQVPAWFLSGLTTLYRLHPTPAALELVRSAARSDSLLRQSVLERGLPENAGYQERALWEAQSYLLVLYLADRFGAEAPFEMAAAVAQQGFEAALQALNGGEPVNLWAGWSRWLFTEAAARAVTWMPYAPVTPTPTATPTITPLPPSRTPTATWTTTPTATSTSLVDRPPTVVVLRQTSTPLAPATRPSNTPLPPGSLPTVTPRAPLPTGQSGESGNNTAGTALLAVLILGGVLVMITAGLVIWRAARK